MQIMLQTIHGINEDINLKNDPLVVSLAKFKARELFDAGNLPKHALVLGQMTIYGYGELFFLCGRFEYPVDPSWLDSQKLIEVHNEPSIKVF